MQLHLIWQIVPEFIQKHPFPETSFQDFPRLIFLGLWNLHLPIHSHARSQWVFSLLSVIHFSLFLEFNRLAGLSRNHANPEFTLRDASISKKIITIFWIVLPLVWWESWEVLICHARCICSLHICWLLPHFLKHSQCHKCVFFPHLQDKNMVLNVVKKNLIYSLLDMHFIYFLNPLYSVYWVWCMVFENFAEW